MRPGGLPWRVRTVAFAICLILASGRPVLAQSGYIDGVFVAGIDGPIELIAWAQIDANGRMWMAQGSLDDVPTVRGGARVLGNIPLWAPASILVASEDIFQNHRAERHELPFGTRRLNATAIDVRIADLETPARVARLLRSVRASEALPAYVFVGLRPYNSGTERTVIRFYPYRLTPDAR